jgi:hypothetical protein
LPTSKDLPLFFIGLRASINFQDVVEEVGYADGHHQALFRLPSYWRELAADGPIRREAFNWYIFS